MNIELLGIGQFVEFTHSGLSKGKLALPPEAKVEGDLIAIGENESYVHCIISGTGDYYGIFKSDDPKHIYQLILKLNPPK